MGNASQIIYRKQYAQGREENTNISMSEHVGFI